MTSQTTLTETNMGGAAYPRGALSRGLLPGTGRVTGRAPRERNLLAWAVFICVYLGLMALIFAPRGSLVAAPGGGINLTTAPGLAPSAVSARAEQPLGQGGPHAARLAGH